MSAPLKLPRLAAFRARKTTPAMPSSTKMPTNVSMLFLPIDRSLSCAVSVRDVNVPARRRYGVENMSAVRTKSIISTPSEAMTTVRVVPWATPSGVALAS